MTIQKLKDEITDLEAAIESSKAENKDYSDLLEFLAETKTELAEEEAKEKTAAPTEAKPKTKAKAKATPSVKKPKVAKEKPAKVEKPKADTPSVYSTDEAVPKSELKDAIRMKTTCEQYAKLMEEDTIIEINNSKVTVPKGDYVIFWNDGFPYTWMTPEGIEKHCFVMKDNDKSKTIVHNNKTDEVKEVKGTVTGPIEKPIETVADLKEAMPPSVEKPKSELTDDAPKDETPKQKAQKKAHKEKVIAKVIEMKKEGCDVAHFVKGVKNVPIRNWLEGMVTDYNKGTTGDVVTKVFITKDANFVAQVKDKSMIGFIYSPSYVQICPDKGTLTNVSKPKVGTYHIEVPTSEVKAYYSDFETEKYDVCRGWIGEVYKMRKEKADKAEIKAKYDQWHKECGNDKMEENYKAHLKWIHEKAAKRRKEENITHYTALRKEKEELRLEAAKK